MKKIMEHTQLPWETSSRHVFSSGFDGANICSMSSPRKSDFTEYIPLDIGDPDFNEAIANAAFIVQAVNSHDQLVAALEESLHLLERTPLERQGSSVEIRISKTVAKARAALNASEIKAVKDNLLKNELLRRTPHHENNTKIRGI